MFGMCMYALMGTDSKSIFGYAWRNALDFHSVLISKKIADYPVYERITGKIDK